MNAALLYQSIFHEVADGLVVTDLVGCVVEANPAFCRMFGYTRDELNGQDFRLLMASNTFDSLLARIRQEGRSSLDAVRKNGSTLSTEVRGTLFMHQQEMHLLAVVRDVTEQVQMYQRLYHTEQERRQVAEGLQGILDTLNSSLELGEILEYIMVQAERLLKAGAVAVFRLQEGKQLLTVEAARGLPEKFVAHMTVPIGGGAVGKAAVEHSPVYIPDLVSIMPTYDVEQVPDRRELLLELSEHFQSMLAVPLYMKDEVYGALALYYAEPQDLRQEDIELAAAFGDQVALAIENTRLRVRAEQAATIAERQRLARDLHDAVTQTLFSANLIADVLPQLWKENTDEFYQRLADLRRLIRGAVAEMRTLLLELRPAALVEMPFGDLVRQLVEATTARTRLMVNLTMEGGEHVLPEEVQTSMYRIAQEALHNVVKHAKAKTLTVNLACGLTFVRLSIIDDGHGFDPAQVPAAHFGLRIMRERAASINADLTITSQQEQGTRIEAAWPGTREEDVL